MRRTGVASKDIRLRHLAWAGPDGLVLPKDHERMTRYAGQGYALWNEPSPNRPGRWTITKAGALADKRQPSM